MMFYEEQQFRQFWVWAFVAIPVVFVALRLWRHSAWLSAGLQEFATIVPVIALVLALAWFSKLTTKVGDDGLVVRFTPFPWQEQRINIADVDAVELVDDWWFYRGRGVRYGFDSTAYVARGNHGVRLRYRDGKTLVIGSQKAGALASAINAYRDKNP